MEVLQVPVAVECLKLVLPFLLLDGLILLLPVVLEILVVLFGRGSDGPLLLEVLLDGLVDPLHQLLSLLPLFELHLLSLHLSLFYVLVECCILLGLQLFQLLHLLIYDFLPDLLLVLEELFLSLLPQFRNYLLLFCVLLDVLLHLLLLLLLLLAHQQQLLVISDDLFLVALLLLELDFLSPLLFFDLLERSRFYDLSLDLVLVHFLYVVLLLQLVLALQDLLRFALLFVEQLDFLLLLFLLLLHDISLLVQVALLPHPFDILQLLLELDLLVSFVNNVHRQQFALKCLDLIILVVQLPVGLLDDLLFLSGGQLCLELVYLPPLLFVSLELFEFFIVLLLTQRLQRVRPILDPLKRTRVHFLLLLRFARAFRIARLAQSVLNLLQLRQRNYLCLRLLARLFAICIGGQGPGMGQVRLQLLVCGQLRLLLRNLLGLRSPGPLRSGVLHPRRTRLDRHGAALSSFGTQTDLNQ